MLTILQVVSLNEKLQVEAKEMPGGEPSSSDKKAADPLPVDIAQIFNMKVEDHMSSGSVGSAVVDEGSPHPVVVDSVVDSYFPADNYGGGGCVAPVERVVQSEEEDGSDDGRSYLEVFASSETEHQNHEEGGEALNWWGNMYYVA